MVSSETRQLLAEQLWDAATSVRPIAPLSERHADLDVADAYSIQQLNIERHLQAGARVVGHKIGLTSLAMQEMMGVNTPDFGHLLDTMVHSTATDIPVDQFISPRVEPEIAFIIGSSLPQQGCRVEDVLAATEYIAPCLELIDSRIADWRINLVDTVADNASSAGVILGEKKLITEDYAALATTLIIDGEVREEGSTAAVLGDPAYAVAWLANALGEYGVSIEPGHIVLSGSCTRAVPVEAQNTVTAAFGEFGSVTAQFI